MQCSFETFNVVAERDKMWEVERKRGTQRATKRSLESLGSRLLEIEGRNTACLALAEVQVRGKGSFMLWGRFGTNGLAHSGPEPASDLAILDSPPIHTRMDILTQLIKLYTTADRFLPEIAACVQFKTKKTEKKMLSLTTRTWSLSHHVWDFCRTTLLCSGASLQDGPPSRAPHVGALQQVCPGHHSAFEFAAVCRSL